MGPTKQYLNFLLDWSLCGRAFTYIDLSVRSGVMNQCEGDQPGIALAWAMVKSKPITMKAKPFVTVVHLLCVYIYKRKLSATRKLQLAWGSTNMINCPTSS